MIKIIDDWYVTVETNPTNYVVRRGEGKRDKEGRPKDKPLAYLKTLRSAVKNIRDQIIAENLSEGLWTVSEALRMVSEVDNRFEEIIEKIGA